MQSEEWDMVQPQGAVCSTKADAKADAKAS
jgi:hypothetical protein